jgi:hypothetical protein
MRLFPTEQIALHAAAVDTKSFRLYRVWDDREVLEGEPLPLNIHIKEELKYRKKQKGCELLANVF